MPKQKPTVICIVGQTATGKTPLGVALAHFLNSGRGAEIISADSQQIYQELDIGTAKPTEKETEGIPYHLVDFVSPSTVYSASQFRIDAEACLQRLINQGKIPIVVGGTGFYIKALLEQSLLPEVSPNPELREVLAKEAEIHGSSRLYERLKSLDPRRAEQLHPNDLFRIIRALEIIDATGHPVPQVSLTQQAPVFREDLHIIWIGLTSKNRDYLRDRIAKRVDIMMEQGWLQEVQDLLKRYPPETQALQVAHGYPELVRHCQREMDYDSAIHQIKINVRQYARRQMTWFQRNPCIHWLTIDTVHHFSDIVSTAQQLILQNENQPT